MTCLITISHRPLPSPPHSHTQCSHRLRRHFEFGLAWWGECGFASMTSTVSARASWPQHRPAGTPAPNSGIGIFQITSGCVPGRYSVRRLTIVVQSQNRRRVLRNDGKTVHIAPKRGHLLVCARGCCCGREDRGKPSVPIDFYKQEYKRRQIRDHVQLTMSGCLGPCPLLNVALVLLRRQTGLVSVDQSRVADHGDL